MTFFSVHEERVYVCVPSTKLAAHANAIGMPPYQSRSELLATGRCVHLTGCTSTCTIAASCLCHSPRLRALENKSRISNLPYCNSIPSGDLHSTFPCFPLHGETDSPVVWEVLCASCFFYLTSNTIAPENNCCPISIFAATVAAAATGNDPPSS